MTARSVSRSLWQRIHAHRTGITQTGWGLTDQALVSAANFVTMFLLARTLSPGSFGSFTLAYTALLFAGSVQFALIVRPHNVLAALRHNEEYARYTTSVVVGQLLLLGLIVVTAVAGLGLVYRLGWGVTPVLTALIPAIVAWQLQECFRRILYTEGRLGGALFNDLISYGGQIAGVVLLWKLQRLTGPAALSVLAVTSTVAAAVGVWQVRRSLARRFDLRLLRENWTFGKWLLGATTGDWLSTQLYVYLAALLLGPAAAGALKAGQLILGPLNIVCSFLDSVLPVRFARAWSAGGGAALGRRLRAAYALTAPLVGGYCLVVAVAAGLLLRLLYGQTYAGYSTLLALTALFTFTSYLPRIVSAALQAQGISRPIFVAYVGAGLTAIGLGVPSIALAGVNGAVIGMILSTLMLSCLLWYAYRRRLTSLKQTEQANADVPRRADDERSATGRPSETAMTTSVQRPVGGGIPS